MRAPAYSMAKYALDALTRVLAHSLEDTPILNAVGPGNTATHPERIDDTDRPVAESARASSGPPPWVLTDPPAVFRDRQPR